ncbi:MAG: TatD family hydrolase [Deltaproteobacteria bacterium]|nr:TatD family hydrolase [Deltaproteobacteria bacterium]MDQ3297439.1 TatD family hydrolase [Myxococcota bacterium]
MIDSHCHLDVDAFDGDREAMIARAKAAGVHGMLVPAIRPRTWDALLALAARHAGAGVRCAIGIHPQIVPDLEADELAGDVVQRIVTAAAAAIAIGECGLDGGTGAHELQELILRAHVRAARETGKPLVIHVLRAHDAAPRILREERIHEVGGVLHSYSGGAELVPIYRDLGLAFSFAGPITYPNARRPVEAARVIPRELLLAETDAPDQAPAAHRGGRSEPAYLAAVIAGLAAARDEDPTEVAELTAANARRLFASW